MQKLTIGDSRVTVNEDLIIWLAGPAITADDIREAIKLFDAAIADHGYVCMISNISELSSLGSEARRVNSEWHRQKRPHFSIALIGGGIVARALVRLILTAAQLVVKGSRTRFDYFDGEAQARVWIDKERTRLRALVKF